MTAEDETKNPPQPEPGERRFNHVPGREQLSLRRGVSEGYPSYGDGNEKSAMDGPEQVKGSFLANQGRYIPPPALPPALPVLPARDG